MKYFVTDQFTGSVNWTPDQLATALKEPLAQIGVTVVRVAGNTSGGLQAAGLSFENYKKLDHQVGRIVKAVLDGREQ
jgi:hypothetical protein